MNLRLLPILITISSSLLISSLAQPPKKNPKDAPKKELTREELEKLGGFEPAPEEPKTIPIVQLELLSFCVPKMDALALATELKDPKLAENAYRALIASVKKKKATLLGSASLETKSGNRAVAEAIAEIRYASEFSEPGGGKFKADAPPDPVKILPLHAPACIGAIPSAFETRNTGLTLEAEPILGSDNQTVDIQFAAQHVRLLGWDTNTVEEKGEIIRRTPQPRFRTNKVSSNVSVRAGQRILAGILESDSGSDTLDLFILHVTLRTVPLK
jgi:hypothetical protein